MKLLGAIVLALSCVGFSSAGEKLKCTAIPASIPDDWVDMAGGCKQKLKDQVKIEIDASLTYLAMGAYFARDKVNRPGFSKLFIEAANEEREHAIKVIEYLLMRGELTKNVGELLSFPLHPLDQVWENGAKALSDALKLETHVTRKIRDIITTCEDTDGKNDYHLVDYLTADFLDEQYKGQRDLAGKLSTLGKMMEENIPLGDFLFDKKLLKGEPL